MRLYGAFTKAEVQSDGTVRVEGIASSESVDDQGEVIKAEAIRAAIPDYMRFPALREMHQLSAAGTTLEAEVGDDGMTRIVGLVVDPIAVSKIKKQVYRGFSIGGRVTARDSENKKIITGLQLNEISLVDRPANPDAVFDIWKSEITEGLTDMPGLATIGDTPAGEKLAAAMNPVQIWTCDHADHRHLAKSAAVKCFEDDAAAKAAGPDGAEQVEEAAAEAASDGETPEATVETEAAEKAAAEAPGEAETAVTETGEAAEGEAAVEDAADVGKRGAEAAEAAQAVIDAATAAMERGEAVLAEPESQDIPAAEPPESHDKVALAAASAGEAEQEATDDAAKAKDSPSAEKRAGAGDLVKSMYDIGDVAQVILFLDGLAERLTMESAMEGDGSTAPDAMKAICAQMCQFLRSLVAEETAEIMAGSEVDESEMVMWAAKVDTLRKAGLNEAADGLTELLEKAGAKHSARDQMMLDAAYTCCAKAVGMDGCTKVQKAAFGDAKECVGAVGGKGFDEMAAKSSEGGALTMMMERFVRGGAHQALADMAHDAISRVTKAAACTIGKVGSRHSKETMDLLGKAHGLLCVAGANCDVKKDEDMGDMEMAAGSGELTKTEDGRVADLAKALEVAQAEKASLAKTLSDIVPLLDRLSKRVEDIALTPLPPMVARRGDVSVSKTADGGGSDDKPMTSEEIAAAIAKMSPDEVELTMFKAAHRKPLYLNGLQNAPEIRDRTGR